MRLANIERSQRLARQSCRCSTNVTLCTAGVNELPWREGYQCCWKFSHLEENEVRMACRAVCPARMEDNIRGASCLLCRLQVERQEHLRSRQE